MSFPRYPEYKDSGVAWLGEVPGHWRVTKIKHAIQFQTGWTPPTGNAAAYDGDNLWANISDLGEKWINDTAKRISDNAASKAKISMSPKGSLMFSFKLSIGQVSFAGADMYTNEAIATFLPSGEVSLDYAYYAFPLFLVQNASVNIYGAKLLNQELIRAANVALPDYSEQQAIAAFLDRETGKIDALVAEQEKLIALLKEKRQAVISHAVTKGLNPKAKMKDSGIAWLGEVPEHWEVLPIKRCANIRYGIGEPPKYQAEGTPLIRATNVHAGKLYDEGLVYVDPSDIPENRIVWLEVGDIIVVRSGAYTGDSAIIPPELGKSIAGFDMVLRCHSVSAKFMQFALLSKYLKEGQIDLEKMRAAQPHLNSEELGASLLVCPPQDEQCLITEFLDRGTAKLDALTTEAQRAIELLKERRSALISAAVTGKIDVRKAA